MKEKIFKLFKKFLKFNYKEYITTSILFLTFVITNLINSSLLRFFTVKNYFDVKPILADLAIVSFIGAFAYFFKPKNRFKYFFIWSIFLTAICVINSIYYTFFMSFSSISLLATSTQVVDVGDALVQNVLQIKDFAFLWQPVLIFIIHKILKKKEYYIKIDEFEKSKIKNRKKRVFNTTIFSCIIAAVFILSLSALEIGRLNKQWNREFIVSKFGIFTYHINDIVKCIEPKFNTLFGYDKAYKEFRDYYEENPVEPKTNKYTNIFEGRNVIMIHTESMQKIAMTTKFNGEEVTPNLNKLASEGIYFSNFYSQVSVGTSSDTEFTVSTSLMPVNNGTVFISYFDREYVGFPQLMKDKGYYTFSMHGNNGSFWNRNVMHKNLGYDKYYSKTSYEIDEEIGLGLSDKSFFRQATDIMKNVKEKKNQPFYSTLIMLTNHTPFDDVDKYGEFPVTMQYTTTNESGERTEATANYLEGTSLGNYFKSSHYADESIGELMNHLDEKGLLENTVVVFYGDHDARLPRKEYNLMFNYNPETDDILDEDDPNYNEFDYYDYELNRSVPLIIWTKDKKFNKEIKTAMGMYDVLPTLGNMLGVYSPYQLGHDIMNLTDNLVPFPNGNWLSNNVYYNNSKEEYISLTSNPISDEYIKQNSEKADDILKVSNSIIVYDLIKADKKKNNEGK